MSRFLLTAVTILDPEGPHDGRLADVLIGPAGIEQIADAGTLASSQGITLLEATGTFLSPGWVDVGTHLCDPGEEWKESQSALAKAAISGGFTTLLPYPASSPVTDHGEQVLALLTRFSQLPIHLHPLGSATEGKEGKEMSSLFEMHQAGAVAFADGAVAFSYEGTLLRILRYLQGFGGLLLTGSLSRHWLSEGFMHEGISSTRMGMPGIPAMAERISVQRDLEILRYAETGKLHFHPLSDPEAIEQIVKARREGLDVTVGVPAYLFDWTDHDLEEFDENLKTVPPLRSQSMVQHLKELIQSGAIDVLCSGHRAEGLEEKAVEFQQAAPGMLTLQTFYAQVQRNLIEPGLLTHAQFVKMISLQPRRRFGLAEAHVEAGSEECTWFDPSREWTLLPGEIPSRAKNSPYLHRLLQGRAKGVLAKGVFHLNPAD